MHCAFAGKLSLLQSFCLHPHAFLELDGKIGHKEEETHPSQRGEEALVDSRMSDGPVAGGYTAERFSGESQGQCPSDGAEKPVHALQGPDHTWK